MAKEIVYREGDYDVTIVVREARAIDGYRRQVLLSEAVNLPTDDKASVSSLDVALTVFRIWCYPALVAATATIKNSADAKIKIEENPDKLDLQTLLELPDSLVRRWEDTVWELNPHWIPKAQVDQEADQKNAS